MNKYLFEVTTPLNFTIHTTSEYWQKLLLKHPELEGFLYVIKQLVFDRSGTFLLLKDNFTLFLLIFYTSIATFIIKISLTIIRWHNELRRTIKRYTK